MNEVMAWAGIGSRKISEEEKRIIGIIASYLSALGWVLYSGNAEGSDRTFQENSNGRCVLILPWNSFEMANYTGGYLARIDAGDTEEGNASVDKYHPRPQSLTRGARRMMCRNFHQIHGIGEWPMVKFVIYCAGDAYDTNGVHTNVSGGTGQAWRISRDLGIPRLNIRGKSYDEIIAKLDEFIKL